MPNTDQILIQVPVSHVTDCISDVAPHCLFDAFVTWIDKEASVGTAAANRLMKTPEASRSFSLPFSFFMTASEPAGNQFQNGVYIV